MQNYAKFDSRVAQEISSSSSSFDLDSSLRGASSYYSGGNDFFDVVLSLVDLVLTVAIAGIVLVGSFFAFYVLISLVRRGTDSTLSEMRTLADGTARLLTVALDRIFLTVRASFRFMGRHRVLSVFVFLCLLALSFAGHVVDGSSRLLRLARIPE
ncbi:MAG TPA: hypothetical protein PK765_00420 [bacterium]|nr:hypothetical protein [bacterium]